MKRKLISIILILVLCIGLSVSAFAENSEQPSIWAAANVNLAIERNLVPPLLQSRYTQAITRAEFCALVVVLYENIKEEITGREMFTDTNDINVEKAAYIGVVAGVGNNNFDPDAPLTREQAAVMLGRLAIALGNPLTTIASTAIDRNEFSSWAVEAIGQIQAAEIMGSTSTTANVFSPRDPYTREQSIITILRLYDIVKQNLTGVIELNLSNQGITNARLSEMVASGEIPTNVTHLRLAVNSISDISPLSGLMNLEALDLWGNQVNDVSPLGDLTNLTELILWGNRFDDISALENLTNLVRFNVGDNVEFNGDLSVLKNFTSLTNLGLGCTWQNRMDFSPIGTLENLESLQLWGVSQLSDISIFENLTNLTHLTIHASGISDFSNLSNLTSMISLDLQGNRINDISTLRLYSFPNLTELYLWNNQISDVSKLSSSTNLTFLALGSNQITDISALKNLTNLTFLDLTENLIAQRDIDELTIALPNTDIRSDAQ